MLNCFIKSFPEHNIIEDIVILFAIFFIQVAFISTFHHDQAFYSKINYWEKMRIAWGKKWTTFTEPNSTPFSRSYSSVRYKNSTPEPK